MTPCGWGGEDCVDWNQGTGDRRIRDSSANLCALDKKPPPPFRSLPLPTIGSRLAPRSRRVTIRQIVASFHRPIREFLRLAGSRAEERSNFQSSAQRRRIEVVKDELLQVVPDWDLARLAALLLEPELSLASIVLQTPHLELGHGTDPSGGVD
jgi:hypothetical protein